MRPSLFPFQETALADLHEKIENAHKVWNEKNPQVISFSAPTGAGKTIIMTALFEEIIFGHACGVSQPDSVFVWLSDLPELNEQTRLKIESKSDKFRARDIRVIDSTFDAEYLTPGGIYFLNTQKLGSDKLLTQKGDVRQFSIWETLANTARRQPKSFYVIIDEAHRGTFTSTQAENKAQSIMQKFILGSKEDKFPVMPLIIGVTATPQRFEKLLSNTTTATQKIIVPPEDVIDSGLLKDRIIIHYPEIAINADMTMFKEAVVNWKTKCEHWEVYCQEQEIDIVHPILVVQVEDGGGNEATRTDIASCITELENLLGRKLHDGEIVHTFNDHETLVVQDRPIHRADASRIEEDRRVRIVLFKMNLSTGWDCPRAETMMSFRHASDYTYIAQLLGRMIRTPLARRVEADAELNNVTLYLPFFDEKTVKTVEQALRDSEAIVPSETGSHKELITLKRDPSFADVFKEMNLITCRVDSARRQPALRRVMALARALTQDRIAPQARRNILKRVLDEFDKEITVLKEYGKYDNVAKTCTAVELRALTIDYNSDGSSAGDTIKTVELSESDLNNLFERAGKILGGGLHGEYWGRHVGRDHDKVKTEVIVLANDNEIMTRLEMLAEGLFNDLYDEHRSSFRELKEERKDVYNKLALSSQTPLPITWELPQSIDFSIGEGAEIYEKHLFIPTEGGNFKTNLNSWESGLVQEELANGAVGWLRNLDRKKWSIEIPYEVNGIWAPMFPDLLIVRVTHDGYVFDVLEPHDSDRKDNYPKAVGLAKFAGEHGSCFGRIQLIRKKKGADRRDHFYRLDMGRLSVRKKVLGITSNAELDRIFDEYADTISS